MSHHSHLQIFAPTHGPTSADPIVFAPPDLPIHPTPSTGPLVPAHLPTHHFADTSGHHSHPTPMQAGSFKVTHDHSGTTIDADLTTAKGTGVTGHYDDHSGLHHGEVCLQYGHDDGHTSRVCADGTVGGRVTYDLGTEW